MIQTYNESALHKTLKEFYATKTNGKTEVKFENFFCDVVSEDGTIIEIQTGSVSALEEKIKTALFYKRKIKIVHTIIQEKIIVTKDENGKIICSRKSAKSETKYDFLRGILKIAPLLRKKNLSIELIYVKILENRMRTEKPVQLLNKSRRFKKNWIPKGKTLEKILYAKNFSLKTLLELLPQKDEFCACDIREKILLDPELDGKNATTKLNAKNKANLCLKILERAGKIKFIKKIKLTKIYARVKNFNP